MKTRFRTIIFLLLLGLLFLPTGPVYAQGPGPDNGQVLFGSNITIKSGDTYDGDLVVFGGNVTVEKGATINGDLVIIGGRVNSNGEMKGDVVVVGGQVNLDESAVVTGDVVTVGGQLDRKEGAQIKGDIVNNVAPKIDISNGRVPSSLPSIPSVGLPGIVNVNYNPFNEMMRVFGSSLVMTILGMLVVLFFQNRMGFVSQAVIEQPLMVGGAGLLTILALVISAVTIILLPVALLGFIAMGFAWLFGVIAMGQEVGNRFARAAGQEWAPVLTTGLGTFVLAFIVNSLQAANNLVPFLACFTWVIPMAIGLMAIGSVVMTRFGTRPAQGPVLNVSSPPLDTGQTPPASEP